MTNNNDDNTTEEKKYENFADFLENFPPNQLKNISDLAVVQRGIGGNGFYYQLYSPEIQIHCDKDTCNGPRFFRCKTKGKQVEVGEYAFIYLTYECSNCQQNQKIFSIAAKVENDGKSSGQCFKFGELPPYGPPTSPKLIKLIGPDREEFLKGRRSENQGLGIGAFTYYRRVVENQKNRIIGEIIKVSEKIGAPSENIDKLKSALKETQFSRALDLAKDSIPESLLINGHNPIRLLHSALSEGVHALTDEQCLEFAESIRIVLGELSERLSQALKDEAELVKALARLMKKNAS